MNIRINKFVEIVWCRSAVPVLSSAIIFRPLNKSRRVKEEENGEWYTCWLAKLIIPSDEFVGAPRYVFLRPMSQQRRG